MSYRFEGSATHLLPLRHTDSPPMASPQPAVTVGGRSVQQVATGGCPDPVGQQTAEVLSELPWFERRMPRPLQDISDDLQPDINIRKTLQDPEAGVAFYHDQVAQRQADEAAHKEYCFAPLLVTLENMHRLTCHILADRQFPQPLTDEERGAFLRLQELIERLIALKAPYKRTVQLAYLMTVLQEMMVARHLVPGLRTTVPELFSGDRFLQFCFSWPSGDGRCREEAGRQIPLGAVFACSFGELVLDGQREGEQHLMSDSGQAQDLLEWLDGPSLFLYPSFEPLDPKDLCCLGHLPIYPLGMMAVHALNADGFMRTPIRFLHHDLLHIANTGNQECLYDSHPLAGLAGRLCFRQLTLDSLPAALQAAGLERAVALVLFYLFHELAVQRAKDLMKEGSALVLWHDLCEVRREHRFDYTAPWRAVSDNQALLACLWVFRVYNDCRLCAAGQRLVLPEARLADFLQRGLPVVQAQWDFFDRHRAALHDWLLAGARMEWASDGSPEYWHLSEIRRYTHYYSSRRLLLQAEEDPEAEGTVRNTDLAYFDRLLTDGKWSLIEEVVGERPPEGRAVLKELFEVQPPCVP